MKTTVAFIKHFDRIRATTGLRTTAYKMSRHGLFLSKFRYTLKKFTGFRALFKAGLSVQQRAPIFYKKNRIDSSTIQLACDILDSSSNCVIKQLVFSAMLTKKQVDFSSALAVAQQQLRYRFKAFCYALKNFKLNYKCLKMSLRRSRRLFTNLSGTLPKKPKKRLEVRMERFNKRIYLLKLRHKRYLWRKLKNTRKFPRFSHQQHYYHKKTLAVGMLALNFFVKRGNVDDFIELNNNKLMRSLFDTMDVYFRFADFNYFMPTLYFDMLVSILGDFPMSNYFVQSLSRHALCVGTLFKFIEFFSTNKRRRRFVLKQKARLTNVTGEQY